jgi:OOP family OmpA-OmpF porin
MKKTLLAIALTGIAAMQGASAQTPTYNPSWYISPSVNVMDSDDVYGIDKDTVGGGLRVGKPLSDMWDIQMGATRVRPDQNGFSYRQNTYGFDGLLMFSRQAFRPFILFGGGAEYDKIRGPFAGHASKTSPYLNAGAGFQWSFNDRAALQVDARRVHGFPSDNAFNAKHSRNDYLTVGLNMAFGNPPAPAPITRTEPLAPPPAPAPVAQPAPPPPPQPRFERLTLSATELFAFNSADLRMPQPKLDQIAEIMNTHADVTDVDINGYADRLGNTKYNQKLSQKRADAVKNYLVGKGINESRLKANGRGEENPVATCDEVKKRAELIKCLEPNRRVEVEQITVQRRVQ